MTEPETRAQKWRRILGGAACLTAGGTYLLSGGEDPWATWAFWGIVAGNFLVCGQGWWHLALRSLQRRRGARRGGEEAT